VRIRDFAPEDRAAVVALWRAGDLVRPWNDPDKDIDRKVARADGMFLVAEAAGTVVGVVMAGYDGHRGWLNYLAVDPDRRSDGIGRALVAEAEARLADCGCPKVNLQIRDTNTDVVRFYEQLGYAVDAAISMGKRLESDLD
jgi:ribosomal protein S18 acetylase RimI-like enzyme